nr:MAG TPA: hypothetical protein [Caudoviricetes sp.]
MVDFTFAAKQGANLTFKSQVIPGEILKSKVRSKGK